MDKKLVIDNFLSDYESFRQHCDDLSFDGQVNPVDGEFYPGVDLDIPEHIKSEIHEKLTEVNGGDPVDINFMFLRLSVAGTDAPHQAHTDSTMGEYSMMLYLNRLDDCEGGTSMVRHKIMGFSTDPINKKQLAAWESDHSASDLWEVHDYCEMMPNRAVIFKANQMHRSEPIGGFGKDSMDGRLVLVCFFGASGND